MAMSCQKEEAFGQDLLKNLYIGVEGVGGGFEIPCEQRHSQFTRSCNSLHVHIKVPPLRTYGVKPKVISSIAWQYRHEEDIRKNTHLRKGLKPGKIEGLPPGTLEMFLIQYPLLCRDP